MRSNDTEIAGLKLPRRLGGGLRVARLSAGLLAMLTFFAYCDSFYRDSFQQSSSALWYSLFPKR